MVLPEDLITLIWLESTHASESLLQASDLKIVDRGVWHNQLFAHTAFRAPSWP